MSQTTKRALAASLKRLLQQKPLSKITVSEITQDCGINRMTFYYHFKDIYDLVEWFCMEDAARALEGKLAYDTWQEGLLNLFQLISDNKMFLKNVYRAGNKEQINSYIITLGRDVVLGMLEQPCAQMSISDADKQFIASFYEYAILGIVHDWIEHDMQEDPAQIVQRTSAVIRSSISPVLEHFRPPP